MQKASDLIKHLQELIKKHGDYPVVGIGFDSDYGDYDINLFEFELTDLVNESGNYRTKYPFKNEETEKVFCMMI